MKRGILYYLSICFECFHFRASLMQKVMDSDMGGAVIGIAAFLSMFVVAYVCRRRTREVSVPSPVVVVREEPEDPQSLS